MVCGSSLPWPDLVYKSASKYGSVDGTYNSPIRTAEGIGSSSVSLSAALSFKGKEDSVAKGDPVDGVGDGDGRKRLDVERIGLNYIRVLKMYSFVPVVWGALEDLLVVRVLLLMTQIVIVASEVPVAVRNITTPTCANRSNLC